ncbi:MAG: hypothetical protein ACXWNC_00565 [Anaerolineales bacterium]
MTKKTFPIIILILGTLIQVTLVPLRAFTLGPNGLHTTSIPTGNKSMPSLQEADLDGNGIAESLDLKRGRLTIFSGRASAWQSPADWRVIQAAFADINHDGHPEVALLVWRPFHPWPVDKWLPHGGRIADFQDLNGQSCQIILIGWKINAYRELWAGSAMADPIKSFEAVDLNGDNNQELVALEGRYSDPLTAPARTLKVWKWNGFGFTVVSSLDGEFSDMTLVQSNKGRILILVP